MTFKHSYVGDFTVDLIRRHGPRTTGMIAAAMAGQGHVMPEHRDGPHGAVAVQLMDHPGLAHDPETDTWSIKPAE